MIGDEDLTSCIYRIEQSIESYDKPEESMVKDAMQLMKVAGPSHVSNKRKKEPQKEHILRVLLDVYYVGDALTWKSVLGW